MAVLTVAAAKAYLNISGTADDALIASTIDTAEAVIAERCGPLEPVARTDRVRPNGTTLALLPPVASLTSITDDGGSSVTTSGLYVDPESGIVERNDGGGFSARYYTVTYQQGRDTCPADLIEAVKVLTKHLWSPQRGVGGRPGASTSDGASNTIPGAGYLLPFRVQELIAPHLLVGIA